MSLNLSTFASPAAAAAAPCSKLTLNISAFNGNTTKVNVGRPTPKSFMGPNPILIRNPNPTPTQPKTAPWNPAASAHLGAGMIRPM